MEFSAVMVVALILFFFSVIAVISYMGIWVHGDAKVRGMESPAMWTVIALLIPNFIGLIAYLIVRETKGKSTPVNQQDASSEKARKNMRRFVRSFIILAIAFIIVIATLITTGIFGAGRLGYGTTISYRSISPKYSVSDLRLLKRNDHVDFSYTAFTGNYKLGSFIIRDGVVPEIELAVIHDDSAAYITIERNDEVYMLEHGDNVLSLEDGRWTIVAHGDGAKDGHFIIHVK